MRTRFRMTAVLMVLGLLAAGCTDDGGGGDDAAGASTTGAEITIAIGQEPSSLDPQLVDSGFERSVNDNVYETLLT
ncbi:MAG: hypothetical protein ACRDKZ_03370, partial [Actinomycetota bacterium]